MTDEPRDETKTLRGFLELVERSPALGSEYLSGVHAADAAEWLHDLEVEDLHEVFSHLATEYQADIIEHSEEALRQEIVGSLPAVALKEVVEELPTDEAVDVLAQADDQVAADVLDAMSAEDAAELRQLATHDPETAGGVMTVDFVTVPVDARIGDAVKEVKKEGEDAEENLGVYVVDEAGRPLGYLSERALLTHSIHEPVKDAMVEPFLVAADEDQEEAANILSKYGLSALAVVGDGGRLLGVVSAEDAQEILAEEVTEDVHRLVGTSGVQQTRLSIRRRVVQRMPLMAVTVVGGLSSARILGWVMPTPGGSGDELQAILRYLPLIIGLAGNVGVQSSTILVRAFATGEVERDRDVSVLFSEVSVGTLIGLLCGIATLFFASYMEWGGAGPDWMFGFAVGAAMYVAVSWASLLGCVVPMLCRRFGIDPAIVAGPFLITLSDISGVGIYILVARALLGLGPA